MLQRMATIDVCLLLLKEAGCDLGQAADDGDTPACVAAVNGHDACLRLLEDAGLGVQSSWYI